MTSTATEPAQQRLPAPKRRLKLKQPHNYLELIQALERRCPGSFPIPALIHAYGEVSWVDIIGTGPSQIKELGAVGDVIKVIHRDDQSRDECDPARIHWMLLGDKADELVLKYQTIVDLRRIATEGEEVDGQLLDKPPAAQIPMLRQLEAEAEIPPPGAPSDWKERLGDQPSEAATPMPALRAVPPVAARPRPDDDSQWRPPEPAA